MGEKSIIQITYKSSQWQKVALFQMNSTLRKLPVLDHSQLCQPGVSQKKPLWLVQEEKVSLKSYGYPSGGMGQGGLEWERDLFSTFYKHKNYSSEQFHSCSNSGADVQIQISHKRTNSGLHAALPSNICLLWYNHWLWLRESKPADFPM